MLLYCITSIPTLCYVFHSVLSYHITCRCKKPPRESPSTALKLSGDHGGISALLCNNLAFWILLATAEQ